MLKFKHYARCLIFIYDNDKCVGEITKDFRRRLYTVRFYGNQEIKSCTTRTLMKAKEIVYNLLGE